MNSIFRKIGYALYLILSMSCAAQAGEDYLDRPTIANAFDIFEKYPERISQGTLVAFNRKESKLATKVVEGGIQVRIFALGDKEETPKPVDAKDDCNIYISYVFPLINQPGGKVVFRKLDEGWLNPTDSDKSIKDGRYYIVFEKSGPTSEKFGLRSADTKHYFGSGLLLVVADDGHASLEKVIDEYKKRKTKLSILRRDLDDPMNKIPCYKHTTLVYSNESADLEPQMVAMCDKDSYALEY